MDVKLKDGLYQFGIYCGGCSVTRAYQSNNVLTLLWQAKLKIRIVCSRAYHALFMHNMLIRPTKEELDNFGDPDFTIFNAGECKANTNVDGITSDTSVGISLKHNQMVILGTEYAGEMKKGVFR